MAHISVLLHECLTALNLRKGMTVLDATFGAGGHSRHIAEAIGREGRLIAFDADAGVFSDAIIAELGILTRFTPIVANFRTIDAMLAHRDIAEIDGALFDLGLSSTQLEESGRGFTFQRDEPLAMTFAQGTVAGETTAMEIVNHWSEETLTTIFKGFGEERFARSIAKGITLARKTAPIETTGALVEVIRANTPVWYQHGRTHFATRVFQALRMATNDELGAIDAGIRGALAHMSAGGRIAVISFHSIEDRAVKQLFRELKEEGSVTFITKKPMISSEDELNRNPRARSAKLRIVKKV